MQAGDRRQVWVPPIYGTVAWSHGLWLVFSSINIFDLPKETTSHPLVSYIRHGTEDRKNDIETWSIWTITPSEPTTSRLHNNLVVMMTSPNGNISTLLALCAVNSPVASEFPSRRPVTWSFDVSFDLRLNKRLSEQSRPQFFRRYRDHHDVTVMYMCNELDLIIHSRSGFILPPHNTSCSCLVCS